ncbi:T9SS type A sorting domain-containing protein [Algibacter mikhailovii]|uniref:T9SS type A sorting domain-containing protein n=1 Tax=Algibacter mikhailovii TaxID=425498 RepID=UPI0024941FF1|nr:T9SS type A sorting domain-containing protein [Algibacter mikhailovii]
MKKIYSIIACAMLLVATTSVSAQADVASITNIIVDNWLGGVYVGTGPNNTDFTGQEILLEQDSFMEISWQVNSNNTSNVERMFMVIKDGNNGNANVGEFINDIQSPGTSTVYTKVHAHKIPASATVGTGLFFRCGGKIYLAGQNENPTFDPNGNQAGWVGAVDVPFTVVPSGSLSTSEKNAFKFAMYPNPVKDILNFTTQETISNVSVVDMLGRVVLSVDNVVDNLDVSSLKNAMYIVKLTSDKGVSTKRFIKN